ncbi:NYN domain-containing protein [Haloactinopolyspora sp.]|uniref:NYN domain-containing protein n=1 Tax=Haloactinopolyspora sp. TaxID=1966353 RepID=UPI002625B5F7|nr:NYN domain-containing protein [Haloactinopolyspora sp.]
MTTLPDSVRAKVVALASDVLADLAPNDVPPSLRPVAKFAPAKRARLGANAIAAALESDAGFRQHVLQAASAADPALAEALETGTVPPAAEPADVAAMAYLLRPAGWEKIVESAASSLRAGAEEERRARESAAIERIREQLDAARASARETRATMKAEIDRLKAENATLRRRLQETRQRLEETRARDKQEYDTVEKDLADSRAALRSAETEARRLRSRLAESDQALEAARRSGRTERSLETARLALLLDTLTEAAAGLRRELALPASSLQPADTVDAVDPKPAQPPQGRARSGDEPAYLDELLTMPRVHMIVDGYNVTKTAWSAMPLEAQRTRLIQGLSALAARTGAEITCVFDGADVAAPPPVAPAQGVRVRFSAPGQSADELIRRMVGAEPEGRPVVVVSSDREVAAAARRPGGRAVEAVALVGLLAR